LEKAKTADEDCAYLDLVGYHNSDWVAKFKPKGSYLKMMKEIYKELETTLNSIQNPFVEEEKEAERKKKEIEKKSGMRKSLKNEKDQSGS